MKDFEEMIFYPIGKTRRQSKSRLEIKTTYKSAAQGFAISINGREYNLYDNGKLPDKKRGDGVYTSNINESTKDKAPVAIDIDSEGQPTSNAKLIIETVPCPPGCRSIIFGTECRVCVKIRWESK